MKIALAFAITFFIYFGKSNAQWANSSSVNNAISVSTNDQQDIKMASDGNGGAIIVWADFRNDPNKALADIYAQRIDKDGYVKWTANGVAVCNHVSDQTAPVIIEDGVGGAIISWQDFRNGNRDIYAQRIDSLGNTVWASNGVSVVTKNFHQRSPRLDSDGANGAIIAWEDSINGNWDIYAQRINSLGNIQWGSGGIAICLAANSQINPRICANTNGGAIITWQDKRNSADYDIYTQIINSNGAVQLAANGIVVCNSANTQSNPKIQGDHAGGAYIAWQDKRNGHYDVYVQKISVSGAVVWSANGIAVCSASGSQSAIDITSESISDGIIVCWKDGRATNTNVYCQKIDGAGVNQWTANGILLSNSSREQLNPNIVGDSNNGAIIAWQDSVNGSWDVYAQRVNSNGTIAWTSGGVAVGNATGNQIDPKNISDGNGGAIFGFQDKRSGNYDVYAHKLEGNGFASAQNNLVNVEVLVYPNPNNGTFTIQLPDSRTKFSYRLVDISGRTVISGEAEQPVILTSGNLSKGCYHLIISTENLTLATSKIIIR